MPAVLFILEWRCNAGTIDATAALMEDILYSVLVVVFFVLAAGYVKASERL